MVYSMVHNHLGCIDDTFLQDHTRRELHRQDWVKKNLLGKSFDTLHQMLTCGQKAVAAVCKESNGGRGFKKQRHYPVVIIEQNRLKERLKERSKGICALQQVKMYVVSACCISRSE